MVSQGGVLEGLDASFLTHPAVLLYSGPGGTFSVPFVDCWACFGRFGSVPLGVGKCPLCDSPTLTAPRPFYLLFRPTVGPVGGGKNFAYFSPGTAPHIFTYFSRVLDSIPSHLPFGIARLGRAFRYGITPWHFIFRVRGFVPMELEFFVFYGDDVLWPEYWLGGRLSWWGDQGVPRSSLVILDVPEDVLSHYSKKTYALMYKFPPGVEELEGIANRTDFVLGSHSKNQNEFEITAKVTNHKDSNS
jgi:Glycyl-tRNA synthetase (class II)